MILGRNQKTNLEKKQRKIRSSFSLIENWVERNALPKTLSLHQEPQRGVISEQFKKLNKIMENKIIYILLIIGLSLIVELLTSPLRMIGFSLCSVVTFAIYFVFMQFILKKHEYNIKPIYILFAVLIGCSFFSLPLDRKSVV